jgi:hypothetical protein
VLNLRLRSLRMFGTACKALTDTPKLFARASMRLAGMVAVRGDIRVWLWEEGPGLLSNSVESMALSPATLQFSGQHIIRPGQSSTGNFQLSSRRS